MEAPQGAAYTPRPSGAVAPFLPESPASTRSGPSLHMPARKLNAKDLKQFDDILRQMLGVVTGDIETLESEAFADASDKPQVSAEDAGSEISSVELSLELLSRDEETAREILDALDRIKTGEFGICETCEKPIRKTRLQAMPHARNCIECQREAEKDLF